MNDASATMERNLICLEASDSLVTAYTIMKQERLRHIPVLRERTLIGVVSDRDIFKWASFRGDILQVPDLRLEKVMTKDPISCRPDTPIKDIARTMIAKKIDCLPVIEGGALVGLVTSSDLLGLLTEGEGHAKTGLANSFMRYRLATKP